MQEVICPETGHRIRLDETTGLIAEARFADVAGTERVGLAFKRIAGEERLSDAMLAAELAKLRGVELAIVIQAAEYIAGVPGTRWRIEDNCLVAMAVT